MKFEIKHRFSGAVLFECEVGFLRMAVELAVQKNTRLDFADLTGADLTGADLKGAYLTGADLTGADLEDIKKDFFFRLAKAKNEVVGLFKKLLDGEIDGTCYEGTCACFVGTIANVRGQDYRTLQDSIGLAPESQSPTEKWFLAIQPGMTDAHPVVAITASWIREFAKENDIALPARKVVWE